VDKVMNEKFQLSELSKGRVKKNKGRLARCYRSMVRFVQFT
jgi:hypothetical protein